ncbi:lysine decarboxylase [Lentinula edodes]|uniref:Lysine decarboxylase n=1 Tax=Lentinula edodes TaxID=5353 RepID=A0A1Q3EG84_LENED|nr:lysine decarboxylase [Lentinula edodes]
MTQYDPRLPLSCVEELKILFEGDGKLPEWGYNELQVVPDLYTQKVRMAVRSDGLGIIQAPLVILNFEDYYTNFVKWIGFGAGEGFISANAASASSVVSSLDDIFEAFSSYSYATHKRLDFSNIAPYCDQKYLGLQIHNDCATFESQD